MTEMKIKLLTVFNLAWGQQKVKTEFGARSATKSYHVRQLVHKRLGRLPWWFSGEDSVLPKQAAQVQSPVGEPRSRTLHGAVKENKTETSDFLDNVGQGTHKEVTIYQVSVCACSRKLKIFFTKSWGKKIRSRGKAEIENGNYEH